MPIKLWNSFSEKLFLPGENWIFESNLFHSMIVDGKKAVIYLMKGKILRLWEEYVADNFGVRRLR